MCAQAAFVLSFSSFCFRWCAVVGVLFLRLSRSLGGFRRLHLYSSFLFASPPLRDALLDSPTPPSLLFSPSFLNLLRAPSAPRLPHMCWCFVLPPPHCHTASPLFVGHARDPCGWHLPHLCPTQQHGVFASLESKREAGLCTPLASEVVRPCTAVERELCPVFL